MAADASTRPVGRAAAAAALGGTFFPLAICPPVRGGRPARGGGGVTAWRTACQRQADRQADHS